MNECIESILYICVTFCIICCMIQFIVQYQLNNSYLHHLSNCRKYDSLIIKHEKKIRDMRNKINNKIEQYNTESELKHMIEIRNNKLNILLNERKNLYQWREYFYNKLIRIIDRMDNV